MRANSVARINPIAAGLRSDWRRFRSVAGRTHMASVRNAPDRCSHRPW